jgi:hypothetical protein
MSTESIHEPIPFSYSELPWGDLIYGTKAELQALGIGVGQAFPGEDGGPKRTLNVTDPRGFSTKIKRWFSSKSFSASIKFPGREMPTWGNGWTTIAHGARFKDCYATRYIRGSSEALVALGLLEPHQFPGMPGMRKVRVTIFPDGSTANGHPQGTDPRSRLHGARHVEMAGKREFQVRIKLSDEDAQRNRLRDQQAETRYQQRISAMTRPPRLQPTAQVVSSKNPKWSGGNADAANRPLSRAELRKRARSPSLATSTNLMESPEARQLMEDFGHLNCDERGMIAAIANRMATDRRNAHKDRAHLTLVTD